MNTKDLPQSVLNELENMKIEGKRKSKGNLVALLCLGITAGILYPSCLHNFTKNIEKKVSAPVVVTVAKPKMSVDSVTYAGGKNIHNYQLVDAVTYAK